MSWSYPIYEPGLVDKLYITHSQIRRHRKVWKELGLCWYEPGSTVLIYDLRGIQQWLRSKKVTTPSFSHSCFDLPEGLTSGIYLLKAETTGRVKIGFSSAIESRLKDIQAMSPDHLFWEGHISGDLKSEAALHQRFSFFREHGEWFLDSQLIRKTFISRKVV